MRLTLTVVLPLCLQLLFTFALIAATRGDGSFVGLGAMLIGGLAIPVTALINWGWTRAQPPLTALQLASRTLYTTLVYPALMLALALFAT